jgi:hypothetical protein
MSSNEKEISDGYRKRAPIDVEGFKSLENVIGARGIRSLHRLVRVHGWQTP